MVTEENGDVVTWTYGTGNQLTGEQRSGDDFYRAQCGHHNVA